MKVSYYNFIAEKESKLVIYNSSTGEHSTYFDDDAKIVKKILEGNFTENIKSELVSPLYDKGFIIDDNKDEFDEVIKKRNKYLNDNGLFIMILPTEQCNFRCVYCYEKFKNPKMEEETINNIKKFVAEKLLKSNKLTVAWFGGEPMLTMDIIDDLSQYFLNLCREQRKPYFSMMTTNGSLLTPENWLRLKRDHITGYQITIDGMKETHDKQRVGVNGEATWDKIISNLRFFRDYIRTKSVNIAIRTNITKEIYVNCNEYLDFVKKEFGNDKRFHFFFHLAQDWGNLDGKKIKDSFCGENEFFDVLEMASVKKIQLNIHEYFIQPGARICFSAKKNSYLFTSEGSVRKCSEHLYEQFNYLYNINLYDKMDEDNVRFWNCISRELPDECTTCKKLPLCYGLVCPAYQGNIKDTCGYDLKDMEKVIWAVYGNNC